MGTDIALDSGQDNGDNEVSIFEGKSQAFCSVVSASCNDTPEAIATKLVSEGILPVEFLTVLNIPLMTLIGRIRDNAKSAIGKSPVLAQALNEDSNFAVTEFVETHNVAIRELMYVSLNIVRLMALEARILTTKDLGLFSNAELEDGLNAAREIEQIVTDRFMSSISERIATYLAQEGISATPNSPDSYHTRHLPGYIFIGSNDFDKVRPFVEKFLADSMPNTKFRFDNLGSGTSKSILLNLTIKY